MDTVGSTTPLPPQPIQITANSSVQPSKEWQQSLDTELRSHTRHKIALAIAPTPDVYAKLLEHHDIVGFVVKLESDMYDISDSLSEYCKLADAIMFYFKEIPYETYLQHKQAKVTLSHALTIPLHQLTSTHLIHDPMSGDPSPPQQQQMISLSKVMEQLDENNPSYACQCVPLSSTNHVPAQNATLQFQEKGIDSSTACPMSPQNMSQCRHQRQQFTSMPAFGTQLSARTPYCDFTTDPFCKNLLPCHDIADPVQPHFTQTNVQSFQQQQPEPPSDNPVLMSNVPWIEESEQEQFGTVPRSGMKMLPSILCSSETTEGMNRIRMPNELMQQLQQISDMVPLSVDRCIELLYQSLPGWSQINVMNNPVNSRLPFSRANINLNVSQQQ